MVVTSLHLLLERCILIESVVLHLGFSYAEGKWANIEFPCAQVVWRGYHHSRLACFFMDYVLLVTLVYLLVVVLAAALWFGVSFWSLFSLGFAVETRKPI